MPLLSRRNLLASGALLPLCVACESLGVSQGGDERFRIVLLGQALIQYSPQPGEWRDEAKFAALFAGADACFTDLETAIRGAHPGTPTREGVFVHVADPSVLDTLMHANVTMLATSNNHAYDLNSAGVMDAISEIDRRGFTHAGSGATLPDATAPAYRRTPHGTVALVSMATGAIREGGAATATRPGVNEIRRDTSGALNADDVARTCAAIGEAAKMADITIAYHHNHYWEKDMAAVPAWQRALARQCVDAGASLFASHGAPLLQGIEVYRGRPIFYDLGSFFFQTATAPDAYGPEVWQSVIADCRCSKAGFESLSLIPVQLNAVGENGPSDLKTRGLPSFAQGPDAERILKHLEEMSAPFGTSLSIESGRAVVKMSA
jgi:poly-gamma-glutamate capsule biosynthesis protein CapA/YwtB (metallophosphatase superfamily)